MFLDVHNTLINNYIDFLEDIIFLVAFIFISLGLKRRILFIGFVIKLISFNLELISNNLLPTVNSLFDVQLFDLTFVLSVTGTLLFLIGLSDKIKLGKLTDVVELNSINLFGFSALCTLFIQVIIRL